MPSVQRHWNPSPTYTVPGASADGRTGGKDRGFYYRVGLYSVAAELNNAYLQQLRLAGAGIATQKNIDIRSEFPSAGVLEVLPRPTKQLQQDPLLDIIILVD